MNNSLYTLKSDELIEAYRAELRWLYGDNYKIDMHYKQGWYYIGSKAYRRMKIIEFIEGLQKRQPEI